MKQRSESTGWTGPHIHSLSTHTRYVNEASFDFAGKGTRLAVGLRVLHEQDLKNGAPDRCKHIVVGQEMGGLEGHLLILIPQS